MCARSFLRVPFLRLVSKINHEQNHLWSGGVTGGCIFMLFFASTLSELIAREVK